MDIDYLLWLQSLREALGPVIEQLANFVTELPNNPITILIPCLIYWCVSKKAGIFILMNLALGNNLNQSIKDTACTYRPWIRDSRVRPSAPALEHATGYSFPSGHSQAMVSIWGSAAISQREKHPVLNILAWVVIALVAFTRNFLGVHTPQDVVVGLLEGVLVLWLSTKVIAWAEKQEPGRLLGIGVALAAIIIVYTLVKPYPVDYVDGVLLVDPHEMQLDAFSNVGILLAFVLGWYLEQRFVQFSCDISRDEKLRRVVIAFIVVAIFFGAARLLKYSVGGIAYAFAKGFMPVLAGVWAGPATSEAIRRRWPLKNY